MKKWLRIFVFLIIFLVALGAVFFIGYNTGSKETDNKTTNDADSNNGGQNFKNSQLKNQPITEKPSIKPNMTIIPHVVSANIESIKKTSNNQKIIVQTTADWAKYKELRDKFSNLDSIYDKILQSAIEVDNLKQTRSYRRLYECNLWNKISPYVKNEKNPYENRLDLVKILYFPYNRDLLSSVLNMLTSDNETLRSIAYEYLVNNIFPEKGEEIISKIVANPDYKEWFDVKGHELRIPCIFQLFTYYATGINAPKFILAFQEYTKNFESKIRSIKNERLLGFNTFFAGLTSHMPTDSTLIDLDPEYWLDFYDQFPGKFEGLQRTKAGEIIAPELTGSMLDIHQEFEEKMRTEKGYYRWFYTKFKHYSFDSVGYPQYLTFVPTVLKDFENAISSNSRSLYRGSLEFLTDACQTIYAKELCNGGISVLKNNRERFCRYFTKVSNYKGFGLKYATELLKYQYWIDQDACNMLVALDEPELIKYLLKYDSRKIDVSWVTAMIRLTRHTFGSNAEDAKLANWEKYFQENLATK